IANDEPIRSVVHQITSIVCNVGPSGARAGVGERRLAGPGVSAEQDAAALEFHARGVNSGSVRCGEMTLRRPFKEEVANVIAMSYRRGGQPHGCKCLREVRDREVFTVSYT